jgi:predicted HTH transcriptional regulator
MKSVAGKSQRPAKKTARSEAPATPARSQARKGARLPAATTWTAKVGAQWTFLTNHSHVLVLLARNPSMVLREVAQQVGVTERAVQRIIADLEAADIVVREKLGRQNHYQIRANHPLRHPIESHRTIGDLLALLNTSGE